MKEKTRTAILISMSKNLQYYYIIAAHIYQEQVRAVSYIFT